ncbi:oxidoreductase [Solihabitans fulvus]|uniref:Oxidoreductase n=1 Tax=Solihabitans fulvus TaxID=1892852 RepID=A0A5B2XKQ7_9PSEU|nr:oxidoreductase [Solihabitans fulvus]KAA2264347.1 oxidoreductase [Solihabitans fulvus]
MGLFDRFRRNKRAGVLRTATSTDTSHLEEWATSRMGVEAYVEPRTTVTETTVVLIAHDGEWTRRRIDGVDGAQKLGRKLSIPVYEVAKVGYPKRMREYTARRRAAERDTGS